MDRERRWFRVLVTNEAGQNMVEFAFTALAFFIIIFGTLDFGRAIYQYNLIASSAREGARMAVIQSNANATVITRVASSSSGFISKGAGTCASLPCTAGDITLSSATAAGVAQATRTCSSLPCGTVTVTVTHVFTPATPLISTIIGPSLSLTASSTMKLECCP
jgi:Flp pilus assembly protein TadG